MLRVLLGLSFIILLIWIWAHMKTQGAQKNIGQPIVPSASTCNMVQLSQQIQQNPRNANNYVNRAACYLQPSATSKPPAQNIRAGMKDLETALQLDPNNYYARHDYAQLAYTLGYDSFAVNEFTKALAVNPNGARSYMGRGWAYYALCQLNSASSDFTRAIRLDPTLRTEVATPQLLVQHNTACSRPPTPVQRGSNCPKPPTIVAFNLSARFVLESEWNARHPGCPIH